MLHICFGDLHREGVPGDGVLLQVLLLPAGKSLFALLLQASPLCTWGETDADRAWTVACNAAVPGVTAHHASGHARICR